MKAEGVPLISRRKYESQSMTANSQLDLGSQDKKKGEQAPLTHLKPDRRDVSEDIERHQSTHSRT